MKIAPMGEVRNNFAKYLAAAEEEPVFVTRNGKIAAVIEHPVAEVYTNPASAEMARRYYQDVGAFEVQSSAGSHRAGGAS